MKFNLSLSLSLIERQHWIEPHGKSLDMSIDDPFLVVRIGDQLLQDVNNNRGTDMPNDGEKDKRVTLPKSIFVIHLLLPVERMNKERDQDQYVS